jgi:hypothetical protein
MLPRLHLKGGACTLMVHWVTKLTSCGLPESLGSLSANGSHETHFNIQRRLYDYQFSLTQTPAELEQRHQAFIHTYNTTAHQGLLKDRRVPPIPVAAMGTAKGHVYPQDELAHAFSQDLFPRTTNRHGCVTLHSYHFYVEAGLPQTQVLLWVSGEQLRAAFENVVLAEYHCRYDWRDHQVKDIHGDVFYPTRFVSPQGTLIPLTPKNPWWCIDLNLAGVGPLVSRPCHSCCSLRSCPRDKVGFIPHWRKGNYDESTIPLRGRREGRTWMF